MTTNLYNYVSANTNYLNALRRTNHYHSIPTMEMICNNVDNAFRSVGIDPSSVKLSNNWNSPDQRLLRRYFKEKTLCKICPNTSGLAEAAF